MRSWRDALQHFAMKLRLPTGLGKRRQEAAAVSSVRTPEASHGSRPRFTVTPAAVTEVGGRDVERTLANSYPLPVLFGSATPPASRPANCVGFRWPLFGDHRLPSVTPRASVLERFCGDPVLQFRPLGWKTSPRPAKRCRRSVRFAHTGLRPWLSFTGSHPSKIDRAWYGPAGHPRQWRIARPRSGDVMPISADGSERPATFQARIRTVSAPYCAMKNEVASAGARATGKK